MRHYFHAAAVVLLTATVLPAAPSPTAAQLSHLPPAVRKTILDTKGDSRIIDVTKRTEDGDLVYSVKVSKDGKPSIFTVSPDGSVSRRKVSVEETPEPVQKAIKDRTINAKLESVSRITDDGDITFEIEINQGKHSRQFTVDLDGGLVSEQVFLEELTPVVQKTVREKSAGSELGDIIKNYDEGETAFEVNITRADQDRYFAVDSDGTLLGEQVFLPELPQPIQMAIREQATNATLGEINRFYGDGVSYEAIMVKHGKSRTFTLDDEGNLLDIQLPLNETPAAVQKTVHEQIKTAKLEMVTKMIDGDEITFQVEFTGTNNEAQTFYVTDKGDLMGLEVELSSTPAAVQQAFQTKAQSGSIEKIIKTTDNGADTYQADLSINGKAATLMVDAAGKPAYEQDMIELSQAPDAVQKTIQSKIGDHKLTSLNKITEENITSYEAEWKEGEMPMTETLNEKGEVLLFDNQ